MNCCYTVYQSVYAFVVNNVSGITIETKESILSQLSNL